MVLGLAGALDLPKMPVDSDYCGGMPPLPEVRIRRDPVSLTRQTHQAAQNPLEHGTDMMMPDRDSKSQGAATAPLVVGSGETIRSCPICGKHMTAQ